eukprot:828292-Karenia_brevis.AAC.1
MGKHNVDKAVPMEAMRPITIIMVGFLLNVNANQNKITRPQCWEDKVAICTTCMPYSLTVAMENTMWHPKG